MNFDYLYEKLKKHEDYFILPSWSDKAESSWFGFLLTVKDDAGFTRDDLIKHLNEKKIGTRLLFAGNVIKQPYFVEKNIKYRIVDNLVNTDLVMTNTFWIGVHPGLSKDMLNYIVNEFNEFIKNMNKT